jgi:hypothetical protein
MKSSKILREFGEKYLAVCRVKKQIDAKNSTLIVSENLFKLSIELINFG